MQYVKKTTYRVEIDFDGKWRIKVADKETHDQREGSFVTSWKPYQSGHGADAQQARAEVNATLDMLKEIKRHEEEGADYQVTI